MAFITVTILASVFAKIVSLKSRRSSRLRPDLLKALMDLKTVDLPLFPFPSSSTLVGISSACSVPLMYVVFDSFYSPLFNALDLVKNFETW